VEAGACGLVELLGATVRAVVFQREAHTRRLAGRPVVVYWFDRG
jgi:hypothetical protein